MLPLDPRQLCVGLFQSRILIPRVTRTKAGDARYRHLRGNIVSAGIIFGAHLLRSYDCSFGRAGRRDIRVRVSEVANQIWRERVRVPDSSAPIGFREEIVVRRGKVGGIWRRGYSRVNYMEETDIRLIVFCCVVINSDRVLVAAGG